MIDSDAKSIKSELIYFKEEILKDMKSKLNKMASKYESQKDDLTQKIQNMEIKLQTLVEKVVTLSNSVVINNSLAEKVDNLVKFKLTTIDTLQTNETKLKAQSSQIKDIIYKLDVFMNENIYYKGIIGPSGNCKFTNFHQFIDYLLQNIKQLNIFKNKTTNVENKSPQNKMDNVIESLRKEMTYNLNNNYNYIKTAIDECEKRIKSNLNIYDDKIMELRLDSHKSINELKEYFDNVNKEWKIIDELKANLSDKIKEELKGLETILTNKIEDYHKECINNYEKNHKLIEDLYKKENNDDNENDNNSKKYHKIESILKKYIEGKISVEQISQLSHKLKMNTSYKMDENNENINLSNINNDNDNYLNNTFANTINSYYHYYGNNNISPMNLNYLLANLNALNNNNNLMISKSNSKITSNDNINDFDYKIKLEDIYKRNNTPSSEDNYRRIRSHFDFWGLHRDLSRVYIQSLVNSKNSNSKLSLIKKNNNNTSTISPLIKI